MASRARRRLVCLLTALLFAISSVGHVYAATEAVMKMPSAAMASAMPDHDMDCGGGSDKGAKANCMAICATSIAILAEPVAVPVALNLRAGEPASERPLPERDLLPEPHPPRT